MKSQIHRNAIHWKSIVVDELVNVFSLWWHLFSNQDNMIHTVKPRQNDDSMILYGRLIGLISHLADQMYVLWEPEVTLLTGLLPDESTSRRYCNAIWCMASVPVSPPIPPAAVLCTDSWTPPSMYISCTNCPWWPNAAARRHPACVWGHIAQNWNRALVSYTPWSPSLHVWWGPKWSPCPPVLPYYPPFQGARTSAKLLFSTGVDEQGACLSRNLLQNCVRGLSVIPTHRTWR